MGIFTAKKEIGPDTVLQRRNDLLFNEIDGEVVMLSIENGEYYGLDKTGSKIWDVLSNSIRLSELIDILILQYNVPYSKCYGDTIDFLKILQEKKLINCD